MSYNGSGTFVVNSSGQPVVTGTVISSTAFNALTADLATGLSTAITKDGQTTTTARIVFAQGVSSTLVTDATSATTGSIITAGGISCQKALFVGTTATVTGAVSLAGITATSLALGGATLGTNALAVTGTTLLNSTLTGAAANFSGAVGVNGGTTGTYNKFATSGRSYFTGGTADPGGDGTNGLSLGYDTGSDYAYMFAGRSGVATKELRAITNRFYIYQVGGGISYDFTGSGFGIGMTPTYPLDITIAANSEQLVRFYNSTSGTAAVAGFQLKNNAPDVAGLNLYSAAFTTAGVKRAGGTYLYAGGDGGLTLATQAAQPIYFAVNNSEVARIDTSGNLLVGTTDSASGFDVDGYVKATGFVSKASGSKALAVSNAVSNVISIGSYAVRSCFLITWVNVTSSGAGNAQYGAMMVYMIGGGDTFVLGDEATCQYAGYRGDPSVTWAVTNSAGTAYLTAYCTNASFSSTLSFEITVFNGYTPTFV